MSRRDAHGIAEEAQEREDWTDATLLDVVLDYISNQDSDEAFSDYLQERSEPGDDTEIAAGAAGLTGILVTRTDQLCSGGREPIPAGDRAYEDRDGWVYCPLHIPAPDSSEDQAAGQ